MIINKEEFNKLPQLDRIEFRQKFNEINVENNFFNFTQSIYLSFKIFIAIIILDIWAYLHNGEWFDYSFYIEVRQLLVLLIVFMLFLDIAYTIVEILRKRKLKSEYFKVEAIKKEVKK